MSNRLRLTPREFVEAFKTWNMIEIMEALTAIEDTFGVKPMLPSEPAPMLPATQVEVEPTIEQDEFTVILTAVGDKRIDVVKALRTIPSGATGQPLGLKEANEFTKNVPATIVEGWSKERAQMLAGQLRAVGATVEVK